MASKIEGRSFDAPIKSYNFDGHDYNTLRVSVDYYKSGWGGGRFEATLTPEYIEVHDGYQTRGFHITGTRDPLGSWTTIELKDAPKNSQKTIIELSAALELAKDAIAYYFDQRNWVRLKWLVESVGRSGYTTTIAELVWGDMEKGANDNANDNENISSTNQNSEDKSMTQNMNAQDYVGKTIVVVNNDKIKYVIKSVDGDKLMTDFCMEGREPMACPVPIDQLTKMQDAGTWCIKDASEELRVKSEEFATAEEPAAEPETTATEEVEEVEDVEEPTAQTVKMKTEMPKDKAEEPKAKTKGNGTRGQSPCNSSKTSHTGDSPHVLKYETYTTKKGKTGAKIVGFREDDAAYLAGPDLHGSKVWEHDKQGNKVYGLLFSHRYAQAAEDVCKALNAGKSVADCQAIIDGCTEERAQKREEWRQKRAERESQANEQEQPKAKTEKLYTEAEVRKAFKTLADASGMSVEDFEPIITAMKAAA